MVRRSLPALVWLCCLLPNVRAAEPAINYLDPPQGRFADDWMQVEMLGEKAGYAHSVLTRDGDLITTRTHTYFKLGRAEQVIEVNMTQSTVETVAGVPLEFESNMSLGQTETKTRGKIKNGKVEITTAQFGFETKQKHDLPVGAKMTWGLFRESIEHGFEPGTAYEVHLYEPSMSAGELLKGKITIEGREKIEIAGKQVEAIKMLMLMQLATGNVDSVSYVDENGQVLMADTDFSGITLRMTRVDRDTALKSFDAPEFFRDTLVHVDTKIDREQAQEIVYELSVDGAGRKIPPLPETSAQTTLERTKQTARIRVRRLDHKKLGNAKPAESTPDLAPYLRPSSAINSKDDAIIAMAKEASGKATKPYEIADTLRIYVSRIIRDKNLNIGFATASEVCRNREGDCTEHAVLLAALGRVKGLPSRVVVGLAYVPDFVGEKNVFGFHMWTQFYLEGQWVDFDAALQESDCSPGRIAVATTPLADSAIGDIAFPIMDVVRGLKIEVKSVKKR